jgi:MFS family permease
MERIYMGIFDKKWQVFLLVGVSIFMSTLDSSIVNVALPYIMEDLSSDVKTVQWVVVVYLLTVTSLLLTFGRLSDIKGRRTVYVAGFLCSPWDRCCAARQ